MSTQPQTHIHTQKPHVPSLIGELPARIAIAIIVCQIWFGFVAPEITSEFVGARGAHSPPPPPGWKGSQAGESTRQVWNSHLGFIPHRVSHLHKHTHMRLRGSSGVSPKSSWVSVFSGSLGCFALRLIHLRDLNIINNLNKCEPLGQRGTRIFEIHNQTNRSPLHMRRFQRISDT